MVNLKHPPELLKVRFLFYKQQYSVILQFKRKNQAEYFYQSCLRNTNFQKLFGQSLKIDWARINANVRDNKVAMEKRLTLPVKFFNDNFFGVIIRNIPEGTKSEVISSLLTRIHVPSKVELNTYKGELFGLAILQNLEHCERACFALNDKAAGKKRLKVHIHPDSAFTRNYSSVEDCFKNVFLEDLVTDNCNRIFSLHDSIEKNKLMEEVKRLEARMERNMDNHYHRPGHAYSGNYHVHQPNPIQSAHQIIFSTQQPTAKTETKEAEKKERIVHEGSKDHKSGDKDPKDHREFKEFKSSRPEGKDRRSKDRKPDRKKSRSRRSSASSRKDSKKERQGSPRNEGPEAGEVRPKELKKKRKNSLNKSEAIEDRKAKDSTRNRSPQNTKRKRSRSYSRSNSRTRIRRRSRSKSKERREKTSYTFRKDDHGSKKTSDRDRYHSRRVRGTNKKTGRGSPDRKDRHHKEASRKADHSSDRSDRGHRKSDKRPASKDRRDYRDKSSAGSNNGSGKRDRDSKNERRNQESGSGDYLKQLAGEVKKRRGE